MEHISKSLLSSLTKEEGNWRPTGDVGIMDALSPAPANPAYNYLKNAGG